MTVKWKWQNEDSDPPIDDDAFADHVLKAKECCIEIFPRRPYCDRGKWEVHIVDEGFPTNPSPIDHADMFPRLFFSLERAKAEMEDWMNERNYTPI